MSRLGPRHDDLGPRHRRGRRRRPARGLPSTPAARWSTPPTSYGDGESRAAARPAARRRRAARRGRRSRPRRGVTRRDGDAVATPRGGTCSPRSTRRCERLRHRLRRPVAAARVGRRARRSRRRWPRSTPRSPRARRATSASPTTPAGRPRRPRPGSGRCPGRAPLVVDPGGVLAAAARHRARGGPGAPRRSASGCCPGRRSAAAC